MATVSQSRHIAGRFHSAMIKALRAGQGILGAACLLVGSPLIITLWLMPIGLPLAFVGFAMLVTAAEALDHT